MLGFLKRSRRGGDAWPLSLPLVRWSKQDVWTLRDAFEGSLILGATGSGKSSGSGATLARALLAAGFGGVVFTVKADEREQWQRYCREAGRERDLRAFGPAESLTFNFLDYELHRDGPGAGLTQNVVALFESVLEVADRGTGGGGRDDEGFWRRSCRQLMTNAVDLLVLAKGRLSVAELYRLVVSAATSLEQVRSESWRAGSFCFQCLAEADKKPKSPQQAGDFEIVTDYFCLEWPGLSDKTRSVILASFTSMINVLNRGTLRRLFDGETNITPADVEQGAILVLDLPVKEFAETGIFAQVIWKRCFQRHIERRNVAVSQRPVFLWADEAQYFVTSSDMLFQSTCRSARVATVLLSQSTSNFEAALGGAAKGKAETAALFANLNTKLLHANSDPVTNEWAATIVGRTLQDFMNSNSSFAGSEMIPPFFDTGRSGQASAGFSQSYEYELQPNVFLGLRTGGPANRGVVDAILFQSGRRFRANGRSWLPVSFEQAGVAKGGRRAK